jgi:hypothetical protein
VLSRHPARCARERKRPDEVGKHFAGPRHPWRPDHHEHIGRSRTQSTLPQPENVLAAIADRTARRFLPEAERLRVAIERCEAATGWVN